MKKIKVLLTDDGVVRTLEIPVKLRQDSFNNVRLECIVPSLEELSNSAFVKVYAKAINTGSDTIWTSQAYSLTYDKDITFNRQAHKVYSAPLPEEFCLTQGDKHLVFAVVDIDDSNNEIIKINPSGSLTLTIYDGGYNFSGVKVAEPDAVTARVNLLSKISKLKIDATKEMPIGVVFSINGYKSPLNEFFKLSQNFPLIDGTMKELLCSIIALNIEPIEDNVVGNQTEFAFTEKGIYTRTNKYNISQLDIGNAVLLESGVWKILNADYVDEYRNGIEQNLKQIDSLYKLINVGTNPVGTFPSQQTMPSKEELDNFVLQELGRTPMIGDEVDFVLNIPDGVDLLYKLKFNNFKQEWQAVPIPGVGTAENTNEGLISGTNNEVMQEKLAKGLVKMLLDIEKGVVKDIKVYNANLSKIVSLITQAVLYDNSNNIIASGVQGKDSKGISNYIKLENGEIVIGDTARVLIVKGKNKKIVYSYIDEAGEIKTDAFVLKSEVGDLTKLNQKTIVDYCVDLYTSVITNQANIVAEEERAKTAEEKLDADKLNKSNINENYFKDIIFTLNGDTNTATANYKNPVTGITETIEITVIGAATSESSGLMTGEMVTALNNALSDIESLKHVGRQLQMFPTYADALLFDWDSIPSKLINDYFVVESDESRALEEEKGQTTKYVLISNDSPITTEKSFAFSGVITTVKMQVATATTLGGVLSSTLNGYIYVESNGAMKLIGYDALVSSINNITSALNSEIARAKAAEEANDQAIINENARALAAELELANSKLNRTELPTKTSEFENDGDGESPYVRQKDMPKDLGDFTNNANYAKTSQIPTDNNQLGNGAGYLTKDSVKIGNIKAYQETDATTGEVSLVFEFPDE